MNDNEFESIFQDINQALRTLGEPDMDAWARRCHYKARRIPELDTLRDFIDDVKPYPDNEDSTSNLGPDRKDCHRELARSTFGF
ncbi:uncharacterized protein LDX57_006830 [Aspergillus melleus]|uniref:uncharacterized protein n=1 Tax=Aspergillus melleus TaxID=138277 RepID=UPI001E8E2909|nr:uncharacterized protein LDX57_006830 [Aspergillus melleus]KAH8429161.1 hypothetical protein LDX57_006830 [Aspergillus melleus]